MTASDKITVRGEPVGQPEPPRLWLYYKPEGLVTSASDEKGRDTVFDHLPEDMPRVMSVGRLDLNSEGLLLLTNDGELKRRLELPSTGWLRKYRVRVKGNPTEPEIEPLRKGITVEGDRFQPMEVKIDRHQGANAWLTVGLREGKNREIRRAMTHIGLTVNRLIRVSYGPFRLNELKPGEVEEIKPRILREQLGMAEDADDAKAEAAGQAHPGPEAGQGSRDRRAGGEAESPAETRRGAAAAVRSLAESHPPPCRQAGSRARPTTGRASPRRAAAVRPPGPARDPRARAAADPGRTVASCRFPVGGAGKARRHRLRFRQSGCRQGEGHVGIGAEEPVADACWLPWWPMWPGRGAPDGRTVWRQVFPARRWRWAGEGRSSPRRPR